MSNRDGHTLKREDAGKMRQALVNLMRSELKRKPTVTKQELIDASRQLFRHWDRYVVEAVAILAIRYLAVELVVPGEIHPAADMVTLEECDEARRRLGLEWLRR